MSFPMKEDVIYFEQLQKIQCRIYPDACDIGVRIDGRERLTVRNSARAHLSNLLSFYTPKRDKWYGGQSWTFHIPFERDGLLVNGEMLKVIWSKDPARRVEFLTVEVKHHTGSPSEFGLK